MNATNSIATTLFAALEITSGCTEPSAIAYCASFAGKYLDEPPESFTLQIDQRTYKNAFAAGIPGAEQRKVRRGQEQLFHARQCGCGISLECDQAC